LPVSGHEDELHSLRRDLFRRAVAHARAGTADFAEGASHIDVAAYVDPERHAAENQKLFRETPLVACLSSDLPEPGSFRLFEDVGVPMVLVRGRDAKVRAFLNICPHRGARLVRQDTGKASRITCRFHGWTFDAEGQAIGVPQEAHFCGQIEDQKHLVACPAEERHGLVFVVATPGASLDLDAHLGRLGPELERLDLDEARSVRDTVFETTANWKYALDTFFESYHLPTLHKETLANNFAAGLWLYDSWGPHHRLVFPHKEMADWVERPEAEWPIDLLGVTYFVFPNTLIFVGNISPTSSFVTLSQLYPRGVGRVDTRMTICAPRGVNSPAHLAEIEATLAAMRDPVEKEDYAVTAESWASLVHLPKGTRFAYGRAEIALQNFHRSVDRALDAA
jgi:phenylpropionate dioxygenase-like ring-hydroxylating dioxygenase large terminal subunit